MALSKILENSISDGAVAAAKLKDFSAAVDLNGVELILDADQDTSITADTDDRIDFKIANVEHFSFSNSSGDTVVKPMVDAKDIIFQQYDGNKLFEINDGNFVSVGGNAAAGGEIRIYEDTDLGTNYTGSKQAILLLQLHINYLLLMQLLRVKHLHQILVAFFLGQQYQLLLMT